MVSRDALEPLPGYPFESHFADVGGHSMHYVDEGPPDAPTVIFLHGNPTWSFYFRRLITALRADFRCIAPDHIGMGLSSRPAPGAYRYTASQRIDDLDQLLEHLQCTGPVTVVAHDWGGLIGLGWAARAPQRLARLVLMNTGAFGLPADGRVPWRVRIFRSPLGRLLVSRFNAFCRGAVRYCAVKGLTPAVRRAYLAPYDRWANREAVFEFVQDIPLRQSDPSYPILAQVEATYDAWQQVPTLLLWGMRDFVFTGQFLERFEALLPQAESLRFDDGGHYLLEDHPGEVSEAIARFLAMPGPR